MSVFYRKGTNQGNADFFSRIVDLGDGTHAVRLTVNELEWCDAEMMSSSPEDPPRLRYRANAEVQQIPSVPRLRLSQSVTPNQSSPMTYIATMTFSQ